MKSAWADFLSPSLDFRAKRFLIVAGACLGFVLLTARAVRAQQATTSPVYGTARIRAVREQGLDGIVAKRRDSRYESGKRSGAWLKYKNSKGQELVIGGYIPGSYAFDSLLVGY